MVRGSAAEEVAENRAGAAQGGGRRTLRSRDAPNRFSAGVESDGGPRGLRGMRFDQADGWYCPLKAKRSEGGAARDGFVAGMSQGSRRRFRRQVSNPPMTGIGPALPFD